jgi:hypothetical protein
MSGLELEVDGRFAGWRRPVGWRIESLAHCRGCGAAIAWARTPADRSAPLDPSGESHFATCPKADRFRQSRSFRA